MGRLQSGFTCISAAPSLALTLLPGTRGEDSVWRLLVVGLLSVGVACFSHLKVSRHDATFVQLYDDKQVPSDRECFCNFPVLLAVLFGGGIVKSEGSVASALYCCRSR